MITHIKAVNRKVEEYKLVDGAIYHQITNRKTGLIQKPWSEVNLDSVLSIHGSVEAYWDFLIEWAKKHHAHSLK